MSLPTSSSPIAIETTSIPPLTNTYVDANPNTNESNSATPVPKRALPYCLADPAEHTGQDVTTTQRGGETELTHAAETIAHQHRSHHLSHPAYTPSIPHPFPSRSISHSYSHLYNQTFPSRRSQNDLDRRIYSHPIYADERDQEEARSKVSAWRAGVRINGEVSPEREQRTGAGVYPAPNGESNSTPTDVPEAPKLLQRQSEFLHAQPGSFTALDAISGPRKAGGSQPGSVGWLESGSRNPSRQGSGSEQDGEQRSKHRVGAGCGGGKADTQKKKVLAERMLDTMHDLLCSTWPEACSFDSSSDSSSPSSPTCEEDQMSGNGGGGGGLMPLRGFIREILRRSKSSCMTLKAAEWYLTRLRRTLAMTSPSAPSSSLPEDSPLHCPRRAFLAALVLAHKFLHDRVYSNRAWAKASGLDICEVSKAELALGCMLDWRLWVGKGDEELPAPMEPQADRCQATIDADQYLPLDHVDIVTTAPPAQIQVDYGSSSAFANAFANSPSSINETAQSCDSLQSSPQNGFRPSRPASALGGPGASHILPASTFNSIGGSFASISPEAMHLHGRATSANRALHHRRGPGSTISVAPTALSLSASMPRLSLDGTFSSWEVGSGPTSSGISPESYLSVDRTDDVICVVHPPCNGEALDEDLQDEGLRFGAQPYQQSLNHHQYPYHHQNSIGRRSGREASPYKCTTGAGGVLAGGCRKRGARGCVEEESRNGSGPNLSSGCSDSGLEGGFSNVSLKRRKTINGSSMSVGSEYSGSPVAGGS